MNTFRFLTGGLIGLLLAGWTGCAKKAAEPTQGIMSEMAMKAAPMAGAGRPTPPAPAALAEAMEGEEPAAEEAAPERVAAPKGLAGGMSGGPPASTAPRQPLTRGRPPADSSVLPGPAQVAKPALDKDAYYSSTYLGGRGQKDRLEKLIQEGVVVDGKQVKLAAFSRDYSQAFTLPTRTALNLSADLERTKVLRQGGTAYLQVGIQGIKKEAPKRAPLNVALVIDCSGSMADEHKLEFVKRAAARFVEGMSASDTVALVTYDDTAQVRAPAQPAKDKARLKQIIGSLQPGNSTNIYEGLEAGYREVKKHLTSDAINLVILLSDGLVTAGQQDPNAFRTLVTRRFDEDIQTTTVGVGIDFDEELMMGIAQAGKGHYHFIKDGGSVEGIFKAELEELTHVIAKALKVRIVLDKDVKLTKIFGAAELTPEETKQVRAEEKKMDQKIYEELGIQKDRDKDEPGIKMVIPHFYLGDSHVIMLEIELPPGKGKRHVADVFLKYKDLVFRANREPKASVAVEYVTRKPEMIASIQRPVKKNLLGFQTGEALMKAAELIQRGDNAGAVRVIDEQMTLLGVAAREWQDRDLDREGQLMAQYRDVIRSLGSRYAADSNLGRYLQKSLTYSGYRLTR